MKTKIITTLLFFLSISTFAQLKINQYGKVGIGIDPHPINKLLIKGDLCLTTFPEIPAPFSSWVELRFKVGNGVPGAEIGSSTGEIAFWSSEVGYNSLYAAHYYLGSDNSIKTNILPVQNALSKITQLKSYSYNLMLNSNIDSKTTYGFLAQEIQNVLPDITDTAKGIMLIDYLQVIPLLVEAIKEQQEVIDSLKITNHLNNLINKEVYKEDKIDSIIKEINKIKDQMTICCDDKLLQESIANQNDVSSSSSFLMQNRPNPFSEKTIIEFEIIEKFEDASIMIFNMQGTLQKTIAITHNGKGQITIKGFELSAGMYLYSLIVDGNEIDTKRMILVN